MARFFFANGTNIAVENALIKKQVINFKKKVEKAISKQILYISELDKITKIVGNRGKADDPSEGLAAIVGTYWLGFHEALPDSYEVLSLFLFWAGTEGGQAAIDKMLPPAPQHIFNLKNLEIKANLEERISFLSGALDKTGIRWTADVINEGIKAGLSNLEITKFLRNKASEVARERADVIAETELVTAMSLVEVEVYKRNGIEKCKWITTLDEQVCEECSANEGAGPIEMGEAFPMGAITPPQHIRCRCYLLPILPEVIEGKIWTGK